MASRFVPEDYELKEDLRDWARQKGLTDAQIDDLEETWRDHQYKRAMHRWDACWRNWVKNSIKWGEVVPTTQPKYRTTARQMTPEQKAEEDRKAMEQMEKLRAMQKFPIIQGGKR